MKTNITCKQAVDFVSKKEEGKLSVWQRYQLWQHLIQCSLCRLFAAQNKIIVKTLAEDSKQPELLLSPEEKSEIVQKVLATEET